MKMSAGKVAAVVVILAGAAWGAWRWTHKDSKTHRYRTAVVERGNIVRSVRATGIVKPIKQVQVGTQVNGPIKKLFADFNSVVKAGDVVAQIDDAVYEARKAQDDANLCQAQAALDQAKAKVARSEKELERSRTLAKKDLVSQSELETAEEECKVLAAQVRLAESAVTQAEAALRVSAANLSYTTIRSPVDGIVVARNVDEGQTVVASMAVQTMYLIATDLRHVQVEASIPEADVGGIRSGQPVSFTVDAYESEFHGTVDQVRLASTSVQNVVTYPVIIAAENPEQRLFPGMTASISCEVGRRDGVLKIPNAALRFRPPESAGGNSHQAAPGGGKKGPEVWILKADQPVAVHVTTGVSDGLFTELVEGDVKEGQELLTGVIDDQQATEAVNPFAPPKMPRRSGRM
jgi:HlyD family secretion protein